jgi:lipopolysaccharide exporter
MPPAPEALGTRIFRGALWMVALRLSVRSIGLVSVMLLARLLVPEDFGVIGTAALVTGVLAILGNTGVSDGLARLPDADERHVWTAWTIELLVAVLIALGIILATPWAAHWLNEPRLPHVLPWFAGVMVIQALGSPGALVLLRDMAFREEFRLRTSQKLLTVAAALGGALYFGDYRGLVAGAVVGAVLTAALTYRLYPYPVRLTLSCWRSFAGFSVWTVVYGAANHLSSVIDEIVVRRMATAGVFGLYHTSRDLGRVLVVEGVAPAAAALLPGLARLRGDPARCARAAAQAVAVAALVACLAGAVVSGAAAEITRVILGPQWTGAATFLAWVALGVAAHALAELHRGILAAVDRAHASALLWVLRAAALAVLCPLAARSGQVEHVAMAFAAVSVVLTLVDYLVVFRLLGQPRAALHMFVRPVLAGAAAWGAIAAVSAWLPLAALPVWALLPMLLAKVLLGATVYVLTVLACWRLAGRPAGGESALLARLPAGWRRILAGSLPVHPG